MDKVIAVFQRNTVCFNISESPPKTQQADAVRNAAQRKTHTHTAGKGNCNPGKCSIHTSS